MIFPARRYNLGQSRGTAHSISRPNVNGRFELDSRPPIITAIMNTTPRLARSAVQDISSRWSCFFCQNARQQPSQLDPFRRTLHTSRSRQAAPNHQIDMQKMRAHYNKKNQTVLYVLKQNMRYVSCAWTDLSQILHNELNSRHRGLFVRLCPNVQNGTTSPLHEPRQLYTDEFKICQQTGWGGQPVRAHNGGTDEDLASRLVPITSAKRIRVTFNASVSDVLPWKFVPQQREVRVLPGETALAFYTATNKGDKDIIGVATYSVTPAQCAPYFSKIQCFCFEEQRLNAGETVDMPVFFYLDPDLLNDFNMKGVETVTLNYTFFSTISPTLTDFPRDSLVLTKLTEARYDDNGRFTPPAAV